ncbi:MAG: FAD-dependent 5-carboxymethylaminomethyl-2-thiouridine(34) oxidoreductase MnmC [Rhizobacter sp.]
MNTQAIELAALSLNAQGQPCSPGHGEDGDPRHEHFLSHSTGFLIGLEWLQNTDARFTVLDTRFALGQRFLAAWAAWREQAEPKAALDFIAVEARPLSHDDLARLHALLPRSQWVTLAESLQAQWPALTPNLHLLSFEQGRVRLLLALGTPRLWLRELVATVDAFVIDPSFDVRACKSLARLAATRARLWARHPSDDLVSLHGTLKTAGFVVEATAFDQPGCTTARYQPPFMPRVPPGRATAHRNSRDKVSERHALIVGAGLAGCATALALARQGWRSTVIDRRSSPAEETSGNAAGLFHGVVHGHDGHHARFGRAAALFGAPWIRDALSHHAGRDPTQVLGEVNGLLRLQTDGEKVAEMRHTLTRLGLSSDYVQALDENQVAHLSGLPENHPAWFYPQGGWVQPRLLCQYWLRESRADFVGNTQVSAISQEAGRWQVLDPDGNTITQAPVLVLANAQHALPLLSPWLGELDWTVEAVRGQISQLPAALADAAGVVLPKLPLAGAGYVLPLAAHGLIFGATSHAGDMDTAVRLCDHQTNLAQLEKLLGQTLSETIKTSNQWQGRTAWRCMTEDRLPIAGPVPDAHASTTDQPRLVPRVQGLHVCTALGSRGITWAPLLAEVVACGISGAVMPLESSLLDAIDPGRFLARAARRMA